MAPRRSITGSDDAGAIESTSAADDIRRQRITAIQWSPNTSDSWAPDRAALSYVEHHLTRFEKTLAITPPGGPNDRILEMGSYLQITPALEEPAGIRRSARLLLRPGRARWTTAA